LRTFLLLLLIPLLSLSCGLIKQEEPQKKTEEPGDILVLNKGGMIQGKILQETPEAVIIRWQDGNITFQRSEILEIKYAAKPIEDASGIALAPPQNVGAEAELDPSAYPRLYLKNGQVVAGTLLSKREDGFYLKQPLPGGGMIEQGFPFDKIERILLWPPLDESALGNEFQNIKKQFPRFSHHKKPPYHVLTDSEYSDLVQYLKALQQFHQNFIVHFFDLIDPKIGPRPLAVVLFANYEQFRQYGGLPEGSNMVGFYVPASRILFLFNAKETFMMQLFFSRSGSVEKNIETMEARVKNSQTIDPAEKLRAQGYLDLARQEIQSERADKEYQAREFTMQIIRHEGGHQLLHLFGIDSDTVYRGAWFSEGLACYLEPEELGGLNKWRLMDLRYETERGRNLMPLQYLLSFRSGAGLHRVLDSSYAILGYAQSWAFVYFLMQGPYREGFLNYLREIPKQEKDFNLEKDLALLEKHLGRPLKELEGEFVSWVRDLIQNKIEAKEYENYRLLKIAQE